MLRRKGGHLTHSRWDLERLQAGGICPTGSAAQNQAPCFALGVSNSPAAVEEGGRPLAPGSGAGTPAAPEEQPADGNRSGKASVSQLG